MSELVRADRLRLGDYTPARVSLATVGHSLATSEILDFQLAHARARDAVHAVWDIAGFGKQLKRELPVLDAAGVKVLRLRSSAGGRRVYLRQPNLVRTIGSSQRDAVRRS